MRVATKVRNIFQDVCLKFSLHTTFVTYAFLYSAKKFIFTVFDVGKNNPVLLFFRTFKVSYIQNIVFFQELSQLPISERYKSEKV